MVEDKSGGVSQMDEWHGHTGHSKPVVGGVSVQITQALMGQEFRVMRAWQMSLCNLPTFFSVAKMHPLLCLWRIETPWKTRSGLLWRPTNGRSESKTNRCLDAANSKQITEQSQPETTLDQTLGTACNWAVR